MRARPSRTSRPTKPSYPPATPRCRHRRSREIELESLELAAALAAPEPGRQPIVCRNPADRRSDARKRKMDSPVRNQSACATRGFAASSAIVHSSDERALRHVERTPMVDLAFRLCPSGDRISNHRGSPERSDPFSEVSKNTGPHHNPACETWVSRHRPCERDPLLDVATFLALTDSALSLDVRKDYHAFDVVGLEAAAVAVIVVIVATRVEGQPVGGGRGRGKRPLGLMASLPWLR